MRGIGTIVNVLAVLFGGSIGIFMKNGLKSRYQEMAMHALGVCTIFVGAAGAFQGMFIIQGASITSQGTMMMILCMTIGSLLGEWINLEDKMESFGEWLKARFGGRDDHQFVDGFVAASLTICVGAMAIVGSIQDGLGGNPSMLYTKAVLDAVIIMVFASAHGKGAVFSAIPVGIWQGSITILARWIQPLLTDQIINDISFVGGIMIFCVGVNLAFGKKFRVGNMLPALLLVVIYDMVSGILL